MEWEISGNQDNGSRLQKTFGLIGRDVLEQAVNTVQVHSTEKKTARLDIIMGVKATMQLMEGT